MELMRFSKWRVGTPGGSVLTGRSMLRIANYVMSSIERAIVERSSFKRSSFKRSGVKRSGMVQRTSPCVTGVTAGNVSYVLDRFREPTALQGDARDTTI